MLGVFVFVIGAAVGSFLNVVADRLPAGQSLVDPPSHCPSCQLRLSARDMVPILSYVWLRGGCRGCSARIPLRLFVVELISGLLFLGIYLKYGLTVEAVVLAVASSILIAVALIDLERGLILNVIVFPSAVAALVLAPFWTELGLSRAFLGNSGMVASFLNSLISGAAAFLIFFVLLLIFPHGMGGGDVKLAGLIGLLVGFPSFLLALWAAVVTGGIIAILLIALRMKSRKETIPFGPFLVLGALIGLLGGSEVISAYQAIVDRVVGA